MCGRGGGGAPEAPQEAMPPISQEQINQAVSLPEGFRAAPVPLSQGGGYAISDPSGAVVQRAETFGDLLAGANRLNIVGRAPEGVYDPETRQFINRTTGQVLDPATAGQITGIVGGREVAIGRPGEYQPGITDLARGLATQRIDLPERQVAGLTADQQRAFGLARSGVGSFQPFLDQATGLTQAGVGALEQARLGTLGLAGQIPGALAPGQAALTQAGQDVQRFAGEGAAALGRGAADTMRFTEQGVQDARRAADASYLVGEQARGLAADVTGRARALQSPLEGRLAETTTGARGIAGRGITGADVAAERARMSTADAQQSLQEAAQLGRLTAMQGIAQLAGTGTMFSPQQAEAFMNQYENAAVDQAMRDIARQGALQQQEVAARAVQAGAFGGSRQAVAETELARNILEQQGRTAAQMRAAGFESASQRAQEAFERAQGRQQNVAQLTGQLGQIGVGASAQAAQAAGQLGLGAEELAQRGALQGAQLGMSAEQFAAANAQAIAQTGLSIEQLAASTGMSAQQIAGQMAGQAGQLGIAAGQLGVQGAQTAGQMGAQAGQMQMQGAQAAGNLGLQSSQLGLSGIQAGLGAQQQAAGLGQGIAGLGQQVAGLGQAQQALNLQDINTLLTTGQAQQRQTQAELEAQYANQFQQAMQPFQQLAFASDIITGAPSGQTSIMTQPGPSTASQLIGLGLTVPAVASGIQTLRG